jgi:iron complex outermembrane receptor protein
MKIPFAASRLTMLALAIALLLLVGQPAAADTQDPLPSDRSTVLKRMSLEELSDLEVVSVSREPEPYGEAPAAIDVITQEDIRRSGATTIAEALRLADSLIVARKNANEWAISARGFNTDLANKLLVMIDGRTVYTPLFSGVFWHRQDYVLEDIDRIEVISGPGGTLWGANAVNGVINIITRSAADSQGLFVSGGGGSQVNGLATLRYGGRFGTNASFRVFGKYAGQDDEYLPDGSIAGDASRMGRGGFRVDAAPTPGITLTLDGELYSGREHLATGGVATVSGGHVLGRWSRALANDGDVSLQVYYDRTHLTDPTPALVASNTVLAPAGTLGDDLDTYDADFHHRFRVGARNRLTWGLGYRFTHDVVQNSPGLRFEPPVLDQQLFSGFLQNEITLAPAVSLTAGSKIEHNDYTGVELEPSARVRWNVNPSHMVWAAVSRAIRAPARVDRDERLATPALSPLVENLLVGGPDFKSETVVAYEAGTRAQLGATVSLSASAFYNQYDDLRSTSLSPPDPVVQLPFPLFFENNLEGDTHGVELSASEQVLDWWRLHGAYTFLSEDIRVKAGRTDYNQALNETADPRHQFRLRSAMNLRMGVEMDAMLRGIGAFQFNDSGVAGTVPGYVELDARVAWHPTTHVEIALAGQNLMHDRHLEYVISSPSPREEISRSVYARAAWRW